ncbi:MAG: ABC transporter permease subunit [Eubacteriales bacterium]
MSKKRYIYGILILLIIWKCLNVFYDSRLIPDPLDTVIYAFSNLNALSVNSAYSMFRLLSAIVLVIIIGMPLGVLLGRSKKIDNIVSPVIYAIYPIPKIAFLSVIMLLFGLGNSSKIILIFFILIFQMVLSVRDGVKNIEDEVYFSVYNLSLSKIQTFKHIIFPSILPNLFTSLRIGIATSFSVLFLAENYATQYGLGYFIMDSWIMANYIRMFAGILAISFWGSCLFLIVNLLERKLCKYNFI